MAVNDKPHSFWYINLSASRIEDFSWLRLEQRMVPAVAPSQKEEVEINR